MHHKLSYWFPILTGAVLLAAAALFWPRATVEAQCGSQASSCKNCHEVQGKDPVNADGTGWHQSHAFGDFCQFCHGGNVQATDEAAAHAGMVPPLADAQTACAACHPTDPLEKAGVYAAALGVEVGMGGGPESGGSAGGDTAPNPPEQQAPPPADSSGGGMVTGLIDYNRQYAETVEGRWSVNWGNVILSAMIVGLLVGGGAFAYFNERKLRGSPAQGARFAGMGQSSETEAVRPAVDDQPSTLPPEVAELLPALAKLDPRGLRALKKLLADPEAASEMLYSFSRIDPQLVEAVRRLDQRELGLLMALAGER